jgi:hypothetical protein
VPSLAKDWGPWGYIGCQLKLIIGQMASQPTGGRPLDKRVRLALDLAGRATEPGEQGFHAEQGLLSVHNSAFGCVWSLQQDTA